jgi:hypothetical protein
MKNARSQHKLRLQGCSYSTDRHLRALEHYFEVHCPQCSDPELRQAVIAAVSRGSSSEQPSTPKKSPSRKPREKCDYSLEP